MTLLLACRHLAPSWHCVTGRSLGLCVLGLLLLTKTATPQSQFANPNPADTAVGVSLRPTLSWTDASTAEYGVRLATAREALTTAPLTATSQRELSVGSDLEPGTTYYWQVVANEASPRAAYGPVWSFTTGGESPTAWWTGVRNVLGFSTLAALLAGLIKWVVDRSNRATDVLLSLEEQFAGSAKGRKQLEYDDFYDQKRASLLRGPASSGDLEDIDKLLRFYVVLFAVRQARQVPDRSLRTAYRYWLAHYYRKDRAEFRQYVNEFFPTLRRWLHDDVKWHTRRKTPWTIYRARFFRPSDFWKSNEFITDTSALTRLP
ncbi:MAG TPA: Ig-like domain-containing protein [Gemmatimonadales bacterium]|nr:Ig-like domain-containing protein [Gemmatimonadales bacterium]